MKLTDEQKAKLIEALDWRPLEAGRALVPGDVLKLSDGSIRLVGDVNEIFGVCDDCPDTEAREAVEVANLWELIICDECLEVKTSHCTNACGT